MDHKTRCIVLRTIKYGDNSLIIDFLSREDGRFSAIRKISNSTKAKIRRQMFQPLTILDADIATSAKSSMSTIRDCRIASIYASIPFEPTKTSIAFFLAEFLHSATQSMHTDMQLYDFVEQSLLWLDASSRGIANFHLMFMMRMSRFLGFYPDLGSYAADRHFDLREGTFTPCRPPHNDFLPPHEAEKMQVLMRMTAANLHLFRMSRTERNRIIDIILSFYRLHIPSFREMKTLEVLRSL